MHISNDLTFRSIWAFILITFGITWGIIGFYIFLNPLATRWFGQLSGTHPLFYLAVYSPAIAASILIVRRSGWTGLRRFFLRLTPTKMPKGWVLFLILGLPLPFFAGAALHGRLAPGAWPQGSVESLLVASLMMLIKGPVEEIGWRGFALPLLQQRMRPLWAALLLGCTWGIWHYPAFLLSGTPQNAWNFSSFFAGTLALSILVTALYNRSKGCILWPMLFHFQLILPLWPDGQPFDTLGFVIFALAAFALNRKVLWDPAFAHTCVLPEGKS